MDFSVPLRATTRRFDSAKRPPRAMSFCVRTLLVLTIAAPATVWAQRPLTYPLQSQSPAQQMVDQAYCYSQAKKQTNVDIVRQPQRPLRTTPIIFSSDAGYGTEPPPLPASAGQATAASAASAPGAATSTGASQSAASAPSSASAGATSGASGAPVPAAAASTGEANLPPLPPPEPPMTTYWRAFGDCMAGRGYGVR
jgi:hypothetical protein